MPSQVTAGSPSLVQGWAGSWLKSVGSVFKEKLERLQHGGRKTQKHWYEELAEEAETGCKLGFSR